MASSTKTAASDVEPDPKRQKLLDAGGPIEDDETARQKMRDAKVYKIGTDETRGDYAGFDPDNVADVKNLHNSIWKTHRIKPMGYFAKEGDLMMMRWLYVNGADTRDVDVDYWFPMYAAAVFGKMEVCKWLFAHGAAKDVNRRTREASSPVGRSPLHSAFVGPHRNLSRWLMLKGALCKDDESGDLDVEIMEEDLGAGVMYSWLVKEHLALLEWANDLHRPRTSFLLFLSGALSAPKNATSTRRNVSPLQLLGGKPGIFEKIGAYVGIHLGRDARIIRQLTEMLPTLNAQIDTDSSGESSSDE